MTRLLSLFFSLLLLIVLPAGHVLAECSNNGFVNPITDICWKCMFPIRIGGIISINFHDTPPDEENLSSPICVCGIRVGLTASFWEPARMVETVKDPYCFPIMGVSMANMQDGSLHGSNRPEARTTFAQAHYYVFPVWGILDLFTDLPCLANDYLEFDLAYITEVDPMWNSDELTFLINPEALLFANPASQAACIADSMAATTYLPINALFWCMGAWGSAYPMSGQIDNADYTEANAGLAARMLYKLSRELLACDPGSDICGCDIRPVWRKTHYRMQLVRPVRDNDCYPIGKSSILWEELKNPAYGGDNFLWMIFRKNLCCAFLY